MLRRLYERTMAIAAHRHALPGLAVVSFAESSFFPIPPDVLLIPMVLAARDRAWLIAGVCTLASALGGLAGYGIGHFLFETLGRWVLDLYGYAAKFVEFRHIYNEWGWWIVVGAGFTPFPYKVVTIASGATGLDLMIFTIASVLSRGARFLLVAALLYWFGPPIRHFIEKNLGWLAGLFFAVLLGGFLAIRYFT